MARESNSQRRKAADLKLAETWRLFYEGNGRPAIAALFTEFDMYTSSPGNDPYAAMRREGQRDVLQRIVQLIGLRPGHFVEQAWDDTDLLERYMRQ